jgi:hypothetical protein
VEDEFSHAGKFELLRCVAHLVKTYQVEVVGIVT